MSSFEQPTQSRDEIERAAAVWLMRCDRGLTAAEQDEYSHWLAADNRHGEAMARMRWGWDELDRLAGLHTAIDAAPDPDLLAPKRPARVTRLVRWVAPAFLAAAAIVALLNLGRPAKPSGGRERGPSATALAAPCERRELEDGSIVQLNRGAAVDSAFTPAFRRVQLVRGEASFTVAKNPSRPFIVEVAGVSVQAVGTVFNVRLERSAVEVLVSEGTVKVDRGSNPGDDASLVHAGQHAVILLGPSSSPRVASLTDQQIATRLAWQPRVLDFTDAPLSDIVAAFNAHNPVHLVLGDPALGAMRLSASFRSDNVAGFVRLMDSDFGMRAEWRGDEEVVLRRK